MSSSRVASSVRSLASSSRVACRCSPVTASNVVGRFGGPEVRGRLLQRRPQLIGQGEVAFALRRRAQPVDPLAVPIEPIVDRRCQLPPGGVGRQFGCVQFVLGPAEAFLSAVKGQFGPVAVPACLSRGG